VGTVCPEAVGALQRVVVEGEKRAPFYEEISRSAAEEFLWYLCRNSAGSTVTMHPERRNVPPYPSHVEALPQRRGVTRDIIAQVVCFMEKHLSDDPTLVGLGRHFGYHPTYLCEKFAASVGQPPIQFLTELRIRRAQSLLAHSELSIRAIAAAVGYKSEQHFSRVFKKRTGLSPYRFRLTQRTRCREICFVDEATATAYGIP
ncbi:MAG TPA: AraC family transcriptional regulator, partial [Limnochordia bacterium]